MDKRFEEVKSKLLALSKQIENREFVSFRPRREWAGADVVISSQNPVGKSGGFYPKPRTVVTPFSGELSWLFERLRDAFADLIDGTSKIEFYDRLANAASSYEGVVEGDGNVDDIVSAVLYEAVDMLEEMEEGTFESFSVGTGGTILADLIKKAEKNGFMSVEATNEFFKRMEEKHRES